MTVNNIFSKMDWKLLKWQKAQLLSISSNENTNITDDQYVAIEGILCLIDAVQDAAVDELGYSENEVFWCEAKKEN